MKSVKIGANPLTVMPRGAEAKKAKKERKAASKAEGGDGKPSKDDEVSPTLGQPRCDDGGAHDVVYSL